MNERYWYLVVVLITCILALSFMHKAYCQTGEIQTTDSLIEIVIQIGQTVANATNIEILKTMPLTTGLLVIAVAIMIAPYLVIAGLARRKFP